MAKPLELRKVIRILKGYNIIYVTGQEKADIPSSMIRRPIDLTPLNPTGKRQSFCHMHLKTW